jgi:K+-transporting ATPase ATPase C chain
MFGALTLLTGVVYPAALTWIAQAVFPRQAFGSIIEQDGRAIGSEWIGQHFDAERYFWGRPSATDPPYNAAASGGSNLGPTNPELLKAVRERVCRLREAHPEQTGTVPVDLVTASGSGLDPHISQAAAEYQVARVARARSLPEDDVRRLVAENTVDRTGGVLGEPRVHVLRLNLALDALPNPR